MSWHTPNVVLATGALRKSWASRQYFFGIEFESFCHIFVTIFLTFCGHEYAPDMFSDFVMLVVASGLCLKIITHAIMHMHNVTTKNKSI
jgi:hypothetical protein